MNAASRITTEVTLCLTEEEAKWLKDVMQNPINNFEKEEKKDRTIRESFWATLNNLGI